MLAGISMPSAGSITQGAVPLALCLKTFCTSLPSPSSNTGSLGKSPQSFSHSGLPVKSASTPGGSARLVPKSGPSPPGSLPPPERSTSRASPLPLPTGRSPIVTPPPLPPPAEQPSSSTKGSADQTATSDPAASAVDSEGRNQLAPRQP